MRSTTPGATSLGRDPIKRIAAARRRRELRALAGQAESQCAADAAMPSTEIAWRAEKMKDS
jgi:hypothetical protein